VISQLLQQSELRVLIERTTKNTPPGADRLINFNTTLAQQQQQQQQQQTTNNKQHEQEQQQRRTHLFGAPIIHTLKAARILLQSIDT